MPNKIKKINFKVLILCLVAVYSFALLGSLLTSSNVNSSWYDSIKPSITPPNWVFPVVWNILFFLIALSLYLSWMKAKSRKTKKKLVLVFSINLILNVLWSFLFFYLQNPLFAFFELIVLWLSILAMILVSYKINKVSSYLLIPYIVWLSFASILNYLISFA